MFAGFRLCRAGGRDLQGMRGFSQGMRGVRQRAGKAGLFLCQKGWAGSRRPEMVGLMAFCEAIWVCVQRPQGRYVGNLILGYSRLPVLVTSGNGAKRLSNREWDKRSLTI